MMESIKIKLTDKQLSVIDGIQSGKKLLQEKLKDLEIKEGQVLEIILEFNKVGFKPKSINLEGDSITVCE